VISWWEQWSSGSNPWQDWMKFETKWVDKKMAIEIVDFPIKNGDFP